MDERAYEVRVSGLVPTKDLLDELSDVEVAEHEFRTVLTGHFADQAALHGFLHRLRAFGLEVVEVRRVTTAEPIPAEPATAEPTPTKPTPAKHATAKHATAEHATPERAARERTARTEGERGTAR